MFKFLVLLIPLLFVSCEPVDNDSSGTYYTDQSSDEDVCPMCNGTGLSMQYDIIFKYPMMKPCLACGGTGRQ